MCAFVSMNVDINSAGKAVSTISPSLKDGFLIWLSNGNARKFSPIECVLCLNKISEYALHEKICSISIFEITQQKYFQSVYNKLLDNKLLRITEKKTYDMFIFVGRLYLEFLKGKPCAKKPDLVHVSTLDSIEKDSNKSIIQINPNDIVAWLVTQPNTKGKLYLENVARSYIYALHSSPSKLILTHENRDVFSCHTVEELDIIQNEFRNAPNFKKINRLTSGSLSAGLTVFRRYLEHFSIRSKDIDNTSFGSNRQHTKLGKIQVSSLPNLMSTEYLCSLKVEFRNYLKQQYPEFSESTVDMHTSDAYFLNNNATGISIAEALVNEESLFIAREKIRDYLRNVCNVKNPEIGANDYLRALWKFKGFLMMIQNSGAKFNRVQLDVTLIGEINRILSTHFSNGFRLNSSIELSRFRSFYTNDFGDEKLLSDEDLSIYIKASGTTFDNKVYYVSLETKNEVNRLAENYFAEGAKAIFYTEFYIKNESWLFNRSIISADMIVCILKEAFPDLSFTQTYFGYTNASVSSVLESEILRIWGDNLLHTYEQIANQLQYIPLERIKFALSQNSDFIWNSIETFSHINQIEITEEERAAICDVALKKCNASGYVSITNLPIESVEEQNFGLSISAIHTAIFRICLSENFDKKGKIITRKGDIFDAFLIMKEYCSTIDKCSLDDLFNVEKELTGEVYRWIPMEAANSTLIRIDKDTYISERYVRFDSELIDEIIGLIVYKDFLPLKAFTTFGAFPDCGQTWNLFLLESYCRRFSQKFRFDTTTVNSRNAGAVIQKECGLSYTEIMTYAVVNADVPLNDISVGSFLYDKGYTGRSSTAKVKEIIEKAKSLKEGGVDDVLVYI